MSPDFKEQDSPIMLTVHTRSYAQGAVTSKGPYILAVGARKKDFRLTGKIIELEFAGTGKARFGKPTFDAVPTGRR